MKICFIMYPWERVDPEYDSTLRMIHEAAKRGHMVALTTPTGLTIRNTAAYASAQVVQADKVPPKASSFYHSVQFKRRLLPLAGFDVIMMRDNPPLDTTVLNFLDSVKHDTFICNDIHGLRVANNKIFTAALYDPAHDYIPLTHVSKNTEYLDRMVRESDAAKLIVKPLNGYGGAGVEILKRDAPTPIEDQLHAYLAQRPNDYVILQEYVEGADQGDIRVLMLNGEAIGAMRRVPGADDPRANIAAGGSAVKHALSKAEKALCRHLGPKLVREGLFFVGLDLIGGKLIEVNVLSPGGLTRINRLNKVRLQAKVIDFLEAVVNAKNLILAQKTEFQRIIEDAVSSAD